MSKRDMRSKAGLFCLLRDVWSPNTSPGSLALDSGGIGATGQSKAEAT